MTDHSSHTTNTLKIPFHHLLFLSFLCGSTDPCPPAAFSRPSLNPPSAVSINASPSSPFRSPRQFISIQDPPDLRAEESLPRLSRFPSLPVSLHTADARPRSPHASKASFLSLRVGAAGRQAVTTGERSPEWLRLNDEEGKSPRKWSTGRSEVRGPA